MLTAWQQQNDSQYSSQTVISHNNNNYYFDYFVCCAYMHNYTAVKQKLIRNCIQFYSLSASRERICHMSPRLDDYTAHYKPRNYKLLLEII